MNTTAKELALGGMFTALGVVLLCLGGVVPLALYACPILASAVLLPVRERCRKRIAWSCYAAIALLGTLLGPDKEASMLFVFLGYYPLVKPKLDAVRSRALRLSIKLLLAVFAVGTICSCCSSCASTPSRRSLPGRLPPSSGRPARWAWRCFSCTT